jgi:hypothetical protein
MKWPLVSRRWAEHLELSLGQMRKERDEAREEARNAVNELIMRLGCAPVSPQIIAANVEQDKKAAELTKQFDELMAGVDAETRLVEENLN